MAKLSTLIEELDSLTEVEKKSKKWIKKATAKHKGALTKTLGKGPSGKIPVKKLKAAASGGGKTAKRARLAMTLRKLAK